MIHLPEKIIEKYWGFTSFRVPQKEIITCVLENKDAIALLPTGGGKSLCFQIPALAQQGVCIVISPLIGKLPLLPNSQLSSLLSCEPPMAHDAQTNEYSVKLKQCDSA